ncbi:histamine H2 receptor-like [Pocillopora verrucosa]|uniref:histamine H2 receptor-like n=1 Tax=Pocillopora verrucosa TaxID=203993 RepID=UPI00333EECB1
MNELFCKEFLDYFPTYTELKDLRLTFITNCIFNNFITHTSIVLNIVTIYAIHKTSAMAKTLKTLLLSFAFSDLAVGLFSQPLYTFFLVKCLQLDNLNCDTYQVLIISGYLFSTASFFGVVAVSVDRFLAVHLHLSYQELVTHRRVVVVVIGKWLCSAFVSLITLWGLPGTRDLIGSVVAAFGFIVTFVVYTRIYFTVRRHKKQIHSMQVQEVAHSDEIKNFIVLIKSTVSLFYVYLLLLICYLPFFICSAVIRILGSSIASKHFFLYSLTLIFLNSSLNPVIYCWKMRHVRHAIMDILRKMSRKSNRPLRINYNGSLSVVQIDN